MIINYLSEILPIMLCALPTLLVWRFFAVRVMGKNGLKTTAAHEAGVILLVGFGIYIAVQTLLPREPRWPTLELINFIPFRVIWGTVTELLRGNPAPLLINFIGNIVIFMPLGLFYGLCYRTPSAKRAALIGFFTSLTAETGQIFSERCSDVDDLWLNTLGALAGYGVYLLIGRFAPSFAEHFKVRKSN
ncbi:MAG: VanZ family protein [Clostridia bacterium]|nr:VanZ family protein [Clostridia bacterium]